MLNHGLNDGLNYGLNYGLNHGLNHGLFLLLQGFCGEIYSRLKLKPRIKI
jgi:hypothetical protein